MFGFFACRRIQRLLKSTNVHLAVPFFPLADRNERMEPIRMNEIEMPCRQHSQYACE